MRLFSPAPWLPGVLRHAHPRMRGQIERPRRYEMGGVLTESPRCAFAFPPFVRQQLAATHPEIVAGVARLTIQRSLRRVVEEFRPDVLLGHGAMPLGRLLQSVSREMGLPYAIIEHSADDVMRLAFGSPLERHYAAVASEAQKVFVVGQWMGDHLRALGWRNVCQIPNGTSMPSPEQVSRPRPAEFAGRKVVLSAATYYRRKGFEELLRGFARVMTAHPDAILVLVSDAEQVLWHEVAALGLEDRVRVLPLMPRNELRQWMVWADLFAMPSWSEAFGLVYVEALACGTPVVMTSDCGLAPGLKLVSSRPSDKDHGWMVSPRDIGSIAAAIDEALLHADLLSQMGRAGRAHVVERFTWRQNAAALLAALLDGRQSTGMAGTHRQSDPTECVVAGPSAHRASP